MNQYRSAKLINIDRVNRVKVTVNPSPKPIQPMQQQVAPPVKKALLPRKPTVEQQPSKPVPSPRPPARAVGPMPRLIPQQSAVRVVKPDRQHLRSAENQRRAGNRPRETSIEAYRDGIMRLKDVGQGRILVIVACGPSVNEVPIEKLNNNPNIDIMCINKPNPRVWPPRFWAFCDQTQYSRNLQYWEGFPGVIINATSVRARHSHQILLRTLSGTGFSKDLVKGYYIGRSTTYANMQTALWMNYPKVFIFGCDMAAVNGETHCYGKNPDVSPENRVERFKQEAMSYEHAASVLSAEDRARFTFCSNYNKFDFLKKFPALDHTKAIDIILEMAKSIKI